MTVRKLKRKAKVDFRKGRLLNEETRKHRVRSRPRAHARLVDYVDDDTEAGRIIDEAMSDAHLWGWGRD